MRFVASGIGTAALIANVAMVGGLPTIGHAQNLGSVLDQGTIQSPILVIDFDRLFAESEFGQQFVKLIEQDGAQIAAENRRIEAELIDEEKALTLQREQMAPDAFRVLATAFDEKVQRLRSEQDAKARALGARTDDVRRQFIELAQPVLQRLMQESGATVILERRAVFAALDAVDVTAQAISQINATLGSVGPRLQDPAENDPAAPPAQDP